MLKQTDIKEIYKSREKEINGYFIEFNDSKKIHITKRRTIIAFLVLIKNGEGSESDIAQGNTTINEIRAILGDKLQQTLYRIIMEMRTNHMDLGMEL